MPELVLGTSSASVAIHIGNGQLGHIGEWISKRKTPPVVVVVSDTTVWPLYKGVIHQSLGEMAGSACHVHLIPPGDASKSLEQLGLLYDAFGQAGLARDGLVLALGGGVVSDLAGLAAATWMRGVRFAICPTTLEADIDAAVGGKTGINHPAGKNMVGAFYQPELVMIDPGCLRTLPERDVVAGMAESIKHAAIADAEFLTWQVKRAEAILRLDAGVMEELIEQNLRIKIAVVEADERETGGAEPNRPLHRDVKDEEAASATRAPALMPGGAASGGRAVLNFGHTIGHAVESWFDYELRHGECVAIGMSAAGWISREMGLLDAADYERLLDALKVFGLPVSAPRRLDVDSVAVLTLGDKKSRGGKRRWVLLNGLGRTVVRDDVPEKLVRGAIERVS